MSDFELGLGFFWVLSLFATASVVVAAFDLDIRR
jgi:hypothetical protein